MRMWKHHRSVWLSMGQFKIKRNRKQSQHHVASPIASCQTSCAKTDWALLSARHFYTAESRSNHQTACTIQWPASFPLIPGNFKLVPSCRGRAARCTDGPAGGQPAPERPPPGLTVGCDRGRNVPAVHGHRLRAQQPWLPVSWWLPQRCIGRSFWLYAYRAITLQHLFSIAEY